MLQISLFAQEPLELVLRIKKAQGFIRKDDVNKVLFDGLNDCIFRRGSTTCTEF